MREGVLERSLRTASGRGDRRIGDERLLLALTTGSGATAAAPAGPGVTHEEVERCSASGPGRPSGGPLPPAGP